MRDTPAGPRSTPRRRAQFDPPDDAVPVALRVVADAVRVLAHVHHHAVVHADGQRVLAGRELAEVVFVRRGQGVVRADELAVHPDARLPVRPFEEQHHALALPVRRESRCRADTTPRRRSISPAAARTAPSRCPAARYFAYSGAVNHDLSTMPPVHFVLAVMSSPMPCPASVPGNLILSGNCRSNQRSLSPRRRGRVEIAIGRRAKHPLP